MRGSIGPYLTQTNPTPTALATIFLSLRRDEFPRVLQPHRPRLFTSAATSHTTIEPQSGPDPPWKAHTQSIFAMPTMAAVRITQRTWCRRILFDARRRQMEAATPASKASWASLVRDSLRSFSCFTIFSFSVVVYCMIYPSVFRVGFFSSDFYFFWFFLCLFLAFCFWFFVPIFFSFLFGSFCSF